MEGHHSRRLDLFLSSPWFRPVPFFSAPQVLPERSSASLMQQMQRDRCRRRFEESAEACQAEMVAKTCCLSIGRSCQYPQSPKIARALKHLPPPLNTNHNPSTIFCINNSLSRIAQTIGFNIPQPLYSFSHAPDTYWPELGFTVLELVSNWLGRCAGTPALSLVLQ